MATVLDRATTGTVEVRPFGGLGKADHGWLKTNYHFSFSSYFDPARTGWGKIRVWNDDWIAGRSGFPPHPHRDMEIITYVKTGAITHQDSMGNTGRTEAGDVQVMAAGTGVTHAEYNLEDEATTLFQIWIETDRPGAPPSWGAKRFPKGDRAGGFVTLASGDGRQDSLAINADARVIGATLRAGEIAVVETGAERHVYLVPSGAVRVNGVEAGARDGVAVTGVGRVEVEALDDVEVVLVDAR